MKTISILITLIVILGCNGHPAAGKWKTTSQNSVSKIIINFDGKAEIYFSSQKTAKYHCFWASFDENNINLDCRSKNQVEKTFTFETKSNSANLKENQTLVSAFKKVLI